MNRFVRGGLLLTLATAGGAFAVRGHHEVVRADSAHALQGAGTFALFNDGEYPTSIKHFGLKPDRGLPIAAIPGPEGDTVVIGAPPKAYRFVYMLPMGLAHSNAFPSWLPVELYGTDWYLTEDWRAKVWSTSGDSEGGPRLEISNGVQFIECKAAAGASITSGLKFDCPEDPEIEVSVGGLSGGRREIFVDAPDGTRQVFLQDFSTGSRVDLYALTKIQKLTAPGSYVDVVAYVREIVDPKGNWTLKPDPERKIHKIVRYAPAQTPAATAHVLSVTTLIWKDTNVETRDCQLTPSTEPQCSNGDHCYDRRCTALRSGSNVSGCYSLLCGDWADGNFLSPLLVPGCKSLLCGTSSNPDACWANQEPCASDPPDLSGGDWKLARIITPQRASQAPTAGAQLTYTFLYSGSTERRSKSLRAIEDNRGPGGGIIDYVPSAHQSRPATGNFVQFGYDLMTGGQRALKAVSFERGYDRTVRRFDFTKELVLRKVWTDRREAYELTYDAPSSDAKTHKVTLTDPFGLKRVMTFRAIGARIPNGNRCDEEEGCNIQLGLEEDEPSSGGLIRMTYADATRNMSAGNLLTRQEVDGSKTTYVLDDANFGRVKEEQNDALVRTFEYLDPRFRVTPTVVKDYALGDCANPSSRQLVKTVSNTLCSPASATTCLPSDYGKSMTTITTNQNAPTDAVTTAVTYAGTSKTVTMSQGTLAIVVGHATGIEPASGVPRDVHVPGRDQAQRVATTQTGTPGATLPACDPRTENCGGTEDMAVSHQVDADPAWPFTEVPPEFTALQVTGKGDATTGSMTADVTAQTQTEDAETRAATGDSASTTFEFDNATGTRKTRTSVENGVTFVEEFDWGKAEYASGTVGQFGQKNNIAALQGTRRKVNGAFVGGNYTIVPTYDGLPFETWRGPNGYGQYRADGTKAPPDFELTQDPRQDRAFVVGCLAQGAGSIISGVCWSDFDCPCGICTAQPGDGRQGVCRTLGAGPSNTVCKRSFLGDSVTTQEFNGAGYSRTHTQEWFKQQCTAPRCAADMRVCDNNP